MKLFINDTAVIYQNCNEWYEPVTKGGLPDPLSVWEALTIKQHNKQTKFELCVT